MLKAHAPSGARRKQLLVLCMRTGLRPSRHTAFCFSSLSPSCFFSGFCLFLWLAVPWTSEQRTPPCTTATLLSRPLSCSFLRGLSTTCCCECSRRPWGMCLSLLPSGAFSHISPPPRASIGLELAFTQTRRLFLDASGVKRTFPTRYKLNANESSGLWACRAVDLT